MYVEERMVTFVLPKKVDVNREWASYHVYGKLTKHQSTEKGVLFVAVDSE